MASSARGAIVNIPGLRQSVNEYLAGIEDLTRQELVWGAVVQEPSPWLQHQGVVTRAVVLVDQHVRERRAGLVCVSPIDVVLDEARALVLQPDVVFVSHERAGILRNQVWGAPDLVVEVESPGTRRRDRTLKLRWYRQYGVREYWLIDPQEAVVTVMALDGERVRRRRFQGNRRLVSPLLPGFHETAAAFFE